MSWKKVKLGDLCIIQKGSTGIQKAIPGQYPLVVTAEERKSHNEYQFDDHAVIIPLVSGTGHGHASINRLHFQIGKFALGSILCAVIPKDKSILAPEYLFLFLSLNKERELVARMRGMANVTLPVNEIAKIEILLPPLEKQIEIVTKYSLLENESKDIFSELKNQLDIIKKLRQAFLFEAMQGKLVKSTSTGDTGQELFKKIKVEKKKLLAEQKIKKEKELPPISDYEIPFEIPKHWIWCRLFEVTNFIDYRGKTPNKITQGVKLITAKNVKYGYFSSEPNEFISEIDYLKHMTRGIPNNGDILFTTEAPLGNACLLESKAKFALAQRIITIQPIILNNKYLLNLMLSKAFQKQLVKKQSGATAKGIKSSRLIEVVIPLPPLDEQQQIVAKLEELMSFCDNLEQNVKESQSYNEMLLQQVLKEALQPKEETKVIPLPDTKVPQALKTLIGAHIINTCNTTDFGRVKFQKLLHLTEYCCKIDFDSQYIQNTAGPHDDKLIKNIETDFKRLNLFKVEQDKTETKRVHYTALSGASQVKYQFQERFKDEAAGIDSLLMKLRAFNLEECETISTIYAVWNNRVIKNETITDELLFNDFLDWSPRKSKLRKDFYKKLFWMREENVIPSGWGKYIDKPKNKTAQL